MNTAFFGSADFTSVSGGSGQMHNSPRTSVCLGLLFFLAAVSMPLVSSAVVPVEVSQAEFTTGVVTAYLTPPPDTQLTNDSRTLVANSPVSDYMKRFHYDDPLAHYFEAGATSGWFQVSVDTAAGSGGYANAYAISDSTFSSLSGVAAEFNIQVLGGGNYGSYTEGFVSLVDLTLNRPLWFYSWSAAFGPIFDLGRPEPYLIYDTTGLIPLGPFDPNPAIVTQNTALAPGHAYRMVLYTASNANKDSEEILMNVWGLEVVPEPNILTLVGLGSLVLLMARRPR